MAGKGGALTSAVEAREFGSIDEVVELVALVNPLLLIVIVVGLVVVGLTL